MESMKNSKSVRWYTLKGAIDKARQVKGPFSREAIYIACRERNLTHRRTGLGKKSRIMVRLADLYDFIDALEHKATKK